MILRELTIPEIKDFSNRRGIDQMVVEDFLLNLEGMSIDDAYEKLRDGYKMENWSIETMGAISDGIMLATTKRKQQEHVKKKAKAG